MLYVAGPMTGIPDYNFPAFKAARETLRAHGYDVTCPAEDVADTGHPWEFYIRRGLRLLLDCDAVALLPRWENSRGARLEVHVAEAMSMPVRTVAEWTRDEAT